MDAEGINLKDSFKKLKTDLNAVETSASVVDVEMMKNPDSDRGDENEEEDDSDCYGDDDHLFEDDNEVADNYAAYLQAQFDKVELPAGVEASFSLSLPPESTASSSNINKPTSSWVPAVAVKSLEAGQGKDIDPESLKKYKSFKTFDIVDDFPDHHFKKQSCSHEPTKEWTKKVQEEWRILEKDLPENIFARACESRMDLMRAAITGSQGTPYHDGLFMFDIHFPPSYPQEPPMVHYHSGGLHINPNLYHYGYVCLSLLNTWIGSGCEKWQPGKSTMLQVLVSIQALILNDKPYFNEPLFDDDEEFQGSEGEQYSIEYNEDVLLLSLKTMVYTINRPLKHFEDLVSAHFCIFARDILAACKAYLAGAPVGSVVKAEFPIGGENTRQLRSSASFNVDLAQVMNTLIPTFSKCGAKDCDQFLVQL